MNDPPIDGSGTTLRFVPRTSNSSTSLIGHRLRERQRERAVVEIGDCARLSSCVSGSGGIGAGRARLRPGAG